MPLENKLWSCDMEEYLITDKVDVSIGTKDAFLCKIIVVEYKKVRGICHSPTTKSDKLLDFKTAFLRYGLTNFKEAKITVYRGNGEVNKFDQENIAQIFGVKPQHIDCPSPDCKSYKTAVVAYPSCHKVVREKMFGSEANKLFENAKPKGR